MQRMLGMRRVAAGLVMAVVGLGSAAVAQKTAKKPVFVVAQDGSGQYRTMAEAIAAVPDAGGAVLRIKPGVYKEKLRIEKNGVELRGMGAGPADVVLSWDDSAKSAGGTGKSGSVAVSGDDFLAENLTIENSWERTHTRMGEGAQAVALLATGDRQVYRKVRLLGYQDTLYAASKTCHAADDAAKEGGKAPCQASRQLYEDCYIEGHVDFIFGDAKAVFDHCTLHAMKSTNVMLTAQSRLFPGEDSGYLFYDCTLTVEPGVGRLILGRPWRAYATVTFVNLKAPKGAISPAGWSEWDGRLATATYAEFNTGPGEDVSGRVPQGKQLTAAEAAKLNPRMWLAGTDGWDPMKQGSRE